MKCEVVAIGTELLLGQIVDTNSSYIGEQLAMVGLAAAPGAAGDAAAAAESGSCC